MDRILIKNGLLVDGTGRKPYRSDLLVAGEVIEKIGEKIDEECADYVIDARGRVVAPGLIDPHTHADLAVITDKQQVNSLYQGITTEVVGLCGLGFVPLQKEQLKENLQYSAGLFGYDADADYDFSSFPKYMSYVKGASVNIAVSATHCASRIAASGFSDVKTAEERNVEKFHETIYEAMESGCIGFSTGLSYYPCAYSGYDELVEIGKILAEYDGLFLTHIRYPKPGADPYDILDEMIHVAKDTGVRLHVLHYKTKYPLDYGHPEKILERFEKANSEGCDITLECSPYNAGSTFLHTVLPGWAMNQGYEGALDNLSNPLLRAKLREDMQIGIKNTIVGNGLPTVFVHVNGHPEYAGKTFEEVEAMRGQDLEDMIIDVLYESKLDAALVGRESLSPEINSRMYDDIMELMKSPLYLVGSDAMPYGEYPHPRTFGCFSKMLRLWREYGLPLEAMIHKMTKQTADRFRLYDRGVLKEGKAADIIIFDPDHVRERSTFEHPRRVSAGMDYVLVNGLVELEEGLPTAAFGGKVVKRQK